MNYMTQLQIAWLMFQEYWKDTFNSFLPPLCPGHSEGYVK